MPHRGGLTGPVGTQEASHGAGLHGEGSVHRGLVTVALGEIDCLDHDVLFDVGLWGGGGEFGCGAGPKSERLGGVLEMLEVSGEWLFCPGFPGPRPGSDGSRNAPPSANRPG